MGLARHGVARALVGRVPLDDLVEGPLRVEHHRPELALDVRLHEPLLVAQLGQPERVGEPLRGVDRQHGDLLAARGHAEGDRRGRGRLADAARARADADLLALEPVADHSRRSSSADSRSSASRPSSGSKMRGSVATGAPAARRRRRSCARSARARRVLGERGRERRPGDSAPAVRGLEAPHLLRLEAGRMERVHDDRVDRHVELAAQRALELDRLVHRHLLGQGDRQDAGLAWVAQERVDPLGLPAHRPDARDARVGARRAQHRESVAGRGSVDDREVVTRDRPRAARAGRDPRPCRS